jgi:glycosyltransferase involved in cell wall biosynthesis
MTVNPTSEVSSFDLSVVVPVYRSQATINELYESLVATLEAKRLSFEIIMVEDCGGDKSWLRISELATKDHRVMGIQLSRNFGQHAATICGLSNSRGAWIATLDDDLEHPPEYLSALYDKALQGYDLVYGVYPRRTHNAWRNICSNFARWLFNKAIPSLNQEYTSFRVIRGNIARSLTQFDSPFPFIDGYLSWLTNRYSIVEVPHHERRDGKSNYTFNKLWTHAINIFVTFSDLPLRFTSWIGLIFFLIGMTWLSIILFGRLFGLITVSGFASIMAAIVLFGGIQLLILGVFGEYLGRMNFKSSRKPLFLVGRTTQRPGSRDL